MDTSKRLIKVLLINCDNLVDLDVVKKHLCDRLPLQLDVEKIYFSVDEIKIKSEEIVARSGSNRPHCAVFLVHAQESRLSINESDAGIGYEKMYSALKQATNDNVIVGIVGDEHSTEENKFVSRWAVNRIQAQFSKDYMQGPKGYVFSWNQHPTEEHIRVTNDFITAALSKLKEVPRLRSERQPLKVIIAGDKNLNLKETQENLFKGVKDKWLDLNILQFHKQNTEDTSTEIMQLGYQCQRPCLGIMIVNNQESRLVLNAPQSAYTSIYKSLQTVTDDKVIVVLAQDGHYGVDQQQVISEDALLGIQSQFKQEYLDGTVGYVFSWNECAQNIHRETLLYYIKSKNLITNSMHEKWVAQMGKISQKESDNVKIPESQYPDQNLLLQGKTSSSGGAKESRICYEDYSEKKVKVKTFFGQKEVPAIDFLKRRDDENTLNAVKKYMEYVNKHNKREIVGIFAYLPDGQIDNRFRANLHDKNILDCKACPELLVDRLQAPATWYDTYVVVERKGNDNYDVSYMSPEKLEAPMMGSFFNFSRNL